jgi:hypothetical protein
VIQRIQTCFAWENSELRSRLPLVFLLSAGVAVAAASPVKALQKSLPRQITKSMKPAPGTYLIPDTHDGTEATGAALIIRGNDLTVDLGAVILRGAPASVAPNARRGVGILVTGRNVTIKNARSTATKSACWPETGRV